MCWNLKLKFGGCNFAYITLIESICFLQYLYIYSYYMVSTCLYKAMTCWIPLTFSNTRTLCGYCYLATVACFKGNDILSALDEEEYGHMIELVKAAILATDLALYFRLGIHVHWGCGPGAMVYKHSWYLGRLSYNFWLTYNLFGLIATFVGTSDICYLCWSTKLWKENLGPHKTISMICPCSAKWVRLLWFMQLVMYQNIWISAGASKDWTALYGGALYCHYMPWYLTVFFF